RGLSDAATAQRVGLPTTSGTRRVAGGRGPAAGLPLSRRTRAIAARAGAGIGAGALVYAGLQTLGPRPQSPGAAAMATAILVALLPRAGWLASAGAFVGWLGWELRDGTALVLLVALAPMPLLLPFAGCAWSIPALALLLGAIGLGPASVAIAGLGGTPAGRIGLGL